MAPLSLRRLPYDQRVFVLAFLAGLPATLMAIWLLAVGPFAPRTRWTAVTALVLAWLSCAFATRNAVVRPLQTLSNLLAALREEDFSFRARPGNRDDALSHVLIEVNALAEILRHQRLGAIEASALVHKVLDEIDVGVFAFDGDQRLRLVNRAGERLLGQPAERLRGQSAGALALSEALAGSAPDVLELHLPGAQGRFEARRGTFREGGLPHRLLVLADLSRTLREQERQAWQRLIRVLAHELNNSLAPISSLAQSLDNLLSREPRPDDWQEDARRGLAVIAARAASLSRFTETYSRLARLPAPRLAPVDVPALVRRVVSLETRRPVTLHAGPAVSVPGDTDQLEQLLINLVRNASEAALETGGDVQIGWQVGATTLEVWVADSGPGLPPSANLFVPFFTTKPQGSGIGLVLSRQIAEAHGGNLVLENRTDGPGCRARLLLPYTAASA
jgi:nitrogen fixation/metabolism regulation signal transduction histidine kinase